MYGLWKYAKNVCHITERKLESGWFFNYCRGIERFLGTFAFCAVAFGRQRSFSIRISKDAHCHRTCVLSHILSAFHAFSKWINFNYFMHHAFDVRCFRFYCGSFDIDWIRFHFHSLQPKFDDPSYEPFFRSLSCLQLMNMTMTLETFIWSWK